MCSPSHGLKRSDIKHPSPHHSPGPKAPGPRPRSVSGQISTTSHDTAVAAKTTRCHQEEGKARPGRGSHWAPAGIGLCPGTTSTRHSCFRSGAGLWSVCGASSGVQTAVGIRQPPPQSHVPVLRSVFRATGDPDCRGCPPSTVASRESQCLRLRSTCVGRHLTTIPPSSCGPNTGS